MNELSAHLTEQDAKAATEATSKRLKAEAGSALARAMSEIHYKAPTNVLPYQLYSIGLAYFRKQQFEQAAVIFNQLLSLSEDASYRRSEIYLLNAICWFKLKHYQLANASLVEAKKMSNEHSPYFRKALLWQAMVAQALGERVKSQDILTMLIAMYPHSEEAMSINRKSGRSIASEGEATHE